MLAIHAGAGYDAGLERSRELKETLNLALRRGKSLIRVSCSFSDACDSRRFGARIEKFLQYEIFCTCLSPIWKGLSLIDSSIVI